MNANGGASPPATRTRVMVALDGSPASLAALRYAVDEARRRGAGLYAIRVLPGVGALPCLDDGHEFFSRMREGVWNSFREALGYVPADAEVSALGARGEPGPALAELADDAADDAVHGRGPGRPSAPSDA